MKKIAFRTMGGEEIGFGHIYRCLSLAKAIKKTDINFEIVFIVNEEIDNIVKTNGFKSIVSNCFENDYDTIKKINFNLIVLDTYKAHDAYLKSVKGLTKVMLFDDNNDVYDTNIPDIVLNGNIHAKFLDYKMDDSTQFLLGLEYLVMNEAYWEDNSSLNSEKKGVLITTGGSDSRDVSPKILKELINTNLEITVIVGPGYKKETVSELKLLKNTRTTLVNNPKSLKKFINKAEYVITATGSTIYEVLLQNTTPILFCLADNQKIAYEYFKEYGVYTIGQYPDIKFKEIIHLLNLPVNEKNKELFKMIDGKGALRVTQKIIDYIN